MVLPLPVFAQAAVEAPAAVPAPAETTTAARGPTIEDDRLLLCLRNAGSDPATSLVQASAWVAQARGAARSKPLECLGQIYTVLGKWDAAESAFAEAAQVALPGDAVRRAALHAQAGNAALAGGNPDRALTHLDAAQAIPGAGPVTRGQVDIDRGRALVALDRAEDAVAAFAAAQRNAPEDPLSWLLGATVARRRGDIGAAQREIEVAGSLAPKDPDIGLEAGVIAMLAGNEAAARKAWESTRLVAPESKAADTARAYLAQLGDAPAPASPKPIQGR